MADWVKSLNLDFKCADDKIFTLCYCNSRLRIASIHDNYVVLAKANCKCDDCVRTEVSASNPEFFNLVEKSLRYRIYHKSINVSNVVHPGDDIQHAIDHYSGTAKEIEFSAGVYVFENLNLKDAHLVISGEADFNNCQFNNITTPITSDFNTNFVGCAFYASDDQPPQDFIDIDSGSVIGNTFYGPRPRRL